jgi:hypothetical protein
MEYLLWTREDILERVDEYTLYCSYLGFEPLIGATYPSPLRSGTPGSNPDTEASFGIFERKYGKGAHEFLWKDQGLGIHGDIFDLVQKLCLLDTRRLALLQVLVDTGMAPGTPSKVVINATEKKYAGYASIEIESRAFNTRELNYWDRINVSKPLLQRYYTKAFDRYWLYPEQQFPKKPRGIGFAYQIWDKYQLYLPWDGKGKKFRTDWTEACVPGFLQLEYNTDLLVITKSMKDIMCLRSFGYEAIAPRGENILLPPECISFMKKRYPRILILFDNDLKHKGAEYEFDKIYVPKLWSTDKDTSDFCDNHGAKETALMLQQIISV